MSYSVKYNLEIISNNSTFENDFIINDLRCTSEMVNNRPEYIFGLDDCYVNFKGFEKFTQKYPDVVFSIEEIGEEYGDFTKIYYKNGKSYRCNAKIIYPEYDESKLK